MFVAADIAQDDKKTFYADPVPPSNGGHPCWSRMSTSSLTISPGIPPRDRNGKVLGVIEIDSPGVARFDAEDQAGIERIAAIYISAGFWGD